MVVNNLVWFGLACGICTEKSYCAFRQHFSKPRITVFKITIAINGGPNLGDVLALSYFVIWHYSAVFFFFFFFSVFWFRQVNNFSYDVKDLPHIVSF